MHFNAELWNIHQLCVLLVLIEKEINPTGKREKNGQGKNLYRDTVFECRDRITREPAKLCRNQQLYVATKSIMNSRKK